MSNKKRYVATITVYCYGQDEKEAFSEAESMCDEINHKYDSNASVEQLEKHAFGELKGFSIDIRNLKNQ